jgi:hypothetical protein
MPSTEPPAEPPEGTATEAPPIMGFVLFISAFAVVYWIFRAWFVRLDRDT